MVTTRKMIVFLFALAMAFALLAATPLTGWAAGSTYTERKIEGWLVRIYSSQEIRLLQYVGDDADVEIPARLMGLPVTGFVKSSAIGEGFFLLPLAIRSITFAYSAEEIPEDFAADCVNLERVVLPGQLLRIGSGAFAGCEKLHTIQLPSTLLAIGDKAFYGCKALSTVTTPAALQTIGASAYEGCSALQTVTLNSGLQSIGDHAFDTCEHLQSIAVPDSVRRIGRFAFNECNALESATLPQDLKVISAGLFASCAKLETVNIPDTVVTIQDQAFCFCHKLQDITLPSSLRSLQSLAFYQCESLTEIHIPGSLLNIGAGAFCGCKGLTEVSIAYGVRTIGENETVLEEIKTEGNSFSVCSQNLRIVLPVSVTKVYVNSLVPEKGNYAYKFLDGEKRYLDRIEFESSSDREGFHYRVPVTFASEYGSVPAALRPYTGEKITLPSMETEGYTFAGWTDPDGVIYDAGAQFEILDGEEAINFRANWTAKDNTVSFVTAKGITPEAKTIASGNTVANPGNQVFGTEYLAGWYTDSACSGEPYDFRTPVLGNLTLYAKWLPAIPVTVDLQNAVQQSHGDVCWVSFGDCLNRALAYGMFMLKPLDEGHQHNTVYIHPDAILEISVPAGVSYSGVIARNYTAENGSVLTIYTDIVNGTASYAPDYGDSASVTITFSDTPKVITNIQNDSSTSTDTLWSLTDKDGNAYQDGSTVNVPTGEAAPVGADLTLFLSAPDGCGFDGTILNGTQEIRIDDGRFLYNFVPAGSVTLNLHFYKRSEYVTLTFQNNTNNSYFTEKYPKPTLQMSGTFMMPACPYRSTSGVFNSWSDGQQSYIPGTSANVPSADMTYTAVWDEARFITYSPNNGYGSMEKTTAFMGGNENSFSAILSQNEFTRNGYAFAGWNTRKNGKGTSYQAGATITVSENTTLYAQWEQANSIRLFQNYDNSYDYIRVEVPLEGSYTLPGNLFPRANYLQTGWNTKADGSGTTYALTETITPTDGLYLYAQWHAHDYQFDSFVWAADGKTAQAKLVCTDDPMHITYADAEIASLSYPADCDTNACTVYTASYGSHVDENLVYDEETALGHLWEEGVWSWSEDFVPTLTFACDRCGALEKPEVTITSEVTTEPAIGQNGEKTYTASAVFAGETYTDSVTEILRADAPACAHSLSLDGRIGVNFYLAVPETDVDVRVRFTVYGETTEVAINPDKFIMNGERKLYKFTCGVAAPEIDTPITGVLLVGGAACKPFTYSVQTYLTELMNDPAQNTKQKLMELASAIATYGFFANEFFDANEEFVMHSLCCTELPDGVWQYALDDTYAPAIDKRDESLIYVGSSLVLRTETAIRHYFRLSDGCALNRVRVTTRFGSPDGNEYRLEPVKNGNAYYVEIPNIPSARLGEAVTVNFVTETTEVTWRYSAMSYVRNVLSDYDAGDPTVSNELANVVKALAYYYQAADAYFSEQGQS